MRIKNAIRWLAACIMPVVIFYLMECYSHNPWAEVRPQAQLYNIILFELLAAILLFLTGSARAALRIEAVAAMIYGLANTYVVLFRGHPIVPWDFYSLNTAISVADNYSFMPSKRMAAVTFVFLLFIVALHWLPMRVGGGRARRVFSGRTGAYDAPQSAKQKALLVAKNITGRFLLPRLLPAVVLSVVFLMFTGLLQQESFWDNHRLYHTLFVPGRMANYNGLAVNFTMNLAYLTVDKPEEYDKSEAEEAIVSYETDTVQAEELPNIIVIMNEAFSDIGILGEFETNRDYMPFMHSLQQNPQDVVSGSTVTGMLNVSVLGGNTANSEFEFLTGNTMAFLPQGSIPYQQYIHNETPSLASYLKSMGYETVAMHPWRASGWERDTVYPMLGFSECYFIDYFSDSQIVRRFASDDACVDKIVQKYEEKDSKPLFLFNVTMQNHGGYKDSYSNLVQDIKVEGVDSFPVEQYLSLIELSDKSLEKLIRYFENQEEKTVIVFFGDHQPNDVVARPIWKLQGIDSSQLNDEQTRLRYEVPYLIWANYDLESRQQEDTSANYLAAELIEWIGLPLSGYQNFLLDVRKEYPIVSAMRLQNAAGEELSYDTAGETLKLYQQLQYYQLFENEGEKDEG